MSILDWLRLVGTRNELAEEEQRLARYQWI